MEHGEPCSPVEPLFKQQRLRRRRPRHSGAGLAGQQMPQGADAAKAAATASAACDLHSLGVRAVRRHLRVPRMHGHSLCPQPQRVQQYPAQLMSIHQHKNVLPDVRRTGGSRYTVALRNTWCVARTTFAGAAKRQRSRPGTAALYLRLSGSCLSSSFLIFCSRGHRWWAAAAAKGYPAPCDGSRERPQQPPRGRAPQAPARTPLHCECRG